MKIVYTIAGLYRAAGMERILSAKANLLCSLGHDVTIVTTEQKGRPNAFPLHQGIRTLDLNIGYEDNNGSSLASKTLNYPFKKIRHFHRLKHTLFELRPDICVSMFCGDETFMTYIKDGSVKILETHFPRFKRQLYDRHGLWKLADTLRDGSDADVVRRFDRFVTLTYEDLGYWGRPAGGTVIPNFVASIPDTPSSLDGKTVTAVGRYCHQKGFERLLMAWAKICTGHPDWSLRLVGDGEQRSMLLELSAKLGISGSVTIGKAEPDMDSVYRSTSVLALSSRYEGLPMVLLEAQSYGIPIVAFDCQCGPGDVITDGSDGRLVKEGDIDGLAAALEEIISNPALMHEMGANARTNSARWDKDTIIRKWIQLFESELSSRR